MEIEYAYIGKPAQFHYAKSKADISKYHQTLIDEYDKFETQTHAKYKDALIEYQTRRTAYDEKKCLVCGSKLRLVQYSEGFWGCPNYNKDGDKHTTFQLKTPPHYHNVQISKNWITDIIKACGLRDKLKAKQVFEFYQSIGFEDLFEKFEGRETGQYINSLIETKQRSKEQEWYAALYLENIYHKVLPQQTIVYKEAGGKQKFCIPDFICSSEFEVLVADAKLDFTNETQLDLYIELVSFMMRKVKDERPVNGAFLMYHHSEYAKPKYPVYILKPWELDGWQNNPYINKSK